MVKTTRRALLLLAAISVALLAPLGARADHCDSRIIIFSSPVGVNQNALTCEVAEHDADTRLINPGSTGVSIRYTLPTDGKCQVAAEGKPADIVNGVLNGLGLENRPFEARCTYNANLDFYSYNSGVIAIDRFAQGCITATVFDEVEENPSNSFHTVGTEKCPGNGF